MVEVKLAPLPPKEAMAYFASKGLAPADVRFDYRDTWRGQHAGSFVVAKAMQDDVLQLIRSEIAAAQAEGRSFRQFAAELEPALRAQGWWGKQVMTDPLTGEEKVVQLGSMHRLRTIFDTNMRTAAAAGRWAQIQRTKRAFPYLRYRQIDRPTKRLQHQRFDGLTRPVDDPIWAHIYPPNGWFCGCSVEQITQGQVDRGDAAVSPPFDLDEVEWENDRTGRHEDVPRGVHPGFDVNPGMIWLDTEARMAALEGQGNHAELVGLASELRLRSLRDGLERGVVVAPGGDVRLSIAGTPEDAAVPLWEARTDLAGSDLILSHPSEDLFSAPEIATLFRDGLRSAGFITPQGSFGSLFVQEAKGYEAARRAISERIASLAAALSGLGPEEEQLVVAHALGLWLDRQGIAAYHLTATGRVSDVLGRYSELIERLLTDTP